MPTVVESRRIYAETRKKRLELDLDYRLGRHAAPHPDPVNIRSLRCISQIVLEATKETKQAKQFLQLMGVDVEKVDEGELIDLCSPVHAYQAIRLREALLQLAELRRILRERIGQPNVLPQEDRMRKILLQEMQQLRKALSTSHLGRNVEEVEKSLANLRHILDTFTFTDEVQQYARKAALAVAQIQGINISHPLLKALAQQYGNKHGSLEEATASGVPLWKKGAWRAGGVPRKEESETVRKVSKPKVKQQRDSPPPLTRGPSLVREEVELQELFQGDEEEEEEESEEETPVKRKRRKRRRSSTAKGKSAAKPRRNSKSVEVPEEVDPWTEIIAGDPAFEVDPLPKRRASAAKAKGLPGRAKRKTSQAPVDGRQLSGVPKEEASKGYTFRRGASDANVTQAGDSSSGFLGSELPTSVAARKPHGQPPSPASATPQSATASATPGSSPARRTTDTPQSPLASRTPPGPMTARASAARPNTSPVQPDAPQSARSFERRPWPVSQPDVLRRSVVTQHVPPEMPQARALTQEELEVENIEENCDPKPLEASEMFPVPPTASTVLDSEASLDLMASTTASTAFGSTQGHLDPERATATWPVLGDEALRRRHSATPSAANQRPSTNDRGRGAFGKRVSWAPLMRSSTKEEKKLPMSPVITRVDTGSLPRPSLPRRPTTSNLETLLQNDGDEHEELEEPPVAVSAVSAVSSIARPLMLPTGWSRLHADKVPPVLIPSEEHPFSSHGVSSLHWAQDDAEESERMSDYGTSSKEIVNQFCTKDLEEWCEQEAMLNWLFSPTPEPSDDGEPRDDWDLGQEQSTISFLSRSMSSSSASEDEQEFLRELQGPGYFEARGREPPHASTTKGLPQIVEAPAPITSPRQARDDDKVCIETVLAYRTKRGFREQPVMSEWQDVYDCKLMELSQCGTYQMPCFCRRCLWRKLPLKL